VATFDFPDDLLAAERAAWDALQAGTLTVDQANAVQQQVAAYAAEAGLDRYTVEMALKKTVRHTESKA